MTEHTALVSGDFDAGSANVGFTVIVNLKADPFDIERYELSEIGRYTDAGYRPHATPVPLLTTYGETLTQELRDAVGLELERLFPTEPHADPRDHFEDYADNMFDP